MFGDMVCLTPDCEYGQLYQKVRTYLDSHFTRMPKVDVYYDAKGTITSESKRHKIVMGNLVIVDIHAKGYSDAIGLLLINDAVELDAVSSGCSQELIRLYGYHD